MDQYEKNVEKVAEKAFNTADKVGRGVNKVAIGCITIVANLFFAAFCLWGVFAALTAYRLETTGMVTQGQIIRLEENSSTDGGCCTYSPVVEFEAGGQTYNFESDNASYPPEYEVGESVNVRYDPNDPNTAQIDRYTERWLMPILLIPSMICGAVVLTFFMVRAWRRGDDVISDMV